MNLLPKEDIGMEVHEIVDQFIGIEQGEGKAILNEEEHILTNGSAIIIPAGTKHNSINTSSDKKLKLYNDVSNFIFLCPVFSPAIN